MASVTLSYPAGDWKFENMFWKLEAPLLGPTNVGFYEQQNMSRHVEDNVLQIRHVGPKNHATTINAELPIDALPLPPMKDGNSYPGLEVSIYDGMVYIKLRHRLRTQWWDACVALCKAAFSPDTWNSAWSALVDISCEIESRRLDAIAESLGCTGNDSSHVLARSVVLKEDRWSKGATNYVLSFAQHAVARGVPGAEDRLQQVLEKGGLTSLDIQIAFINGWLQHSSVKDANGWYHYDSYYVHTTVVDKMGVGKLKNLSTSTPGGPYLPISGIVPST